MVRRENWLIRLPVTQETVGSNPTRTATIGSIGIVNALPVGLTGRQPSSQNADSIPIYQYFGAVVQLAERLTVNQVIGSSSLPDPAVAVVQWKNERLWLFSCRFDSYQSLHAIVSELVDERDLKSCDQTIVRVRFPPLAPSRKTSGWMRGLS